MIRAAVLCGMLLGATAAAADTVEAVRTLRSGTVVMEGDVRVVYGEPRSGMARHLDEVIGKELRSSVHRGRMVRLADLGPPTLVRRNDIVTLFFRQGTLSIRGEGRALGDGGMGERLRVMNLDSRMTVTGRISGPGLVEVTR